MKKSVKLISLAAALFMVSCGTQESTNSTPGSAFVPSDSSVTDSSNADSTGTSDSSTDEASTIQERDISAKDTTTGNLDANGKFYADYASLADEQEDAKELVIDIAEEGDVLLKNENHALPLSASEKRVTLLGMHTVNLVTAGGGSGAGTTGNNNIEYSTLEKAFQHAGYKVNPTTISLYDKYTTMGIVANELPLDYYTPSVISSYYAYDGAAVLTFSRFGTENADLKTHDVVDHADKDDHILELDDNEKALVKHAKQYFNKVIVLINSSNIMEIPDLAAKKTADNLGVDAILWVGGVGNNGTEAIGRILDGTVNPSGHTSDIWTSNFKHDPSWTNFAYNSQNYDDGNRMNAMLYDKDGNITNFAEVEYREGLYNGYKFYETKATDMGAAGENWYREEVLYPFGFGLSYTTFKWEWQGVKTKANIDRANQTITAQVKVTNTGLVAGKDVVQIYYSAPYKKGGIEKASNNLVNFAKTKLLNPGESDVVTIEFVAQDMASYDYDDKNNNSFMGYELEAGDYTITANKDSHTPVLSMTRTVAEDMKMRKDYLTGRDVENIFSNDDMYKSTTEEYLANSISRGDEGGLTQPKPASIADRTVSDEVLEMLEDQDIYNHYEVSEADPYFTNSVPEGWTQDANNNLLLADMSGVDYQDLRIENGVAVEGNDAGSQKWKQFMNQLSWEDMCILVAGDSVKGPGSQAIDKIGKTADGYSNGPIQYAGGTLFPSAPIIAATFNTKLAYKMGRFVGNEAIFLSNNLWAGPACNTHRSPFSGRNFEYYSQDGWHAARFVAECIKGATDKGVITLVKHFFLNDQESYRADYGGVITMVDEQSMRENYLKPFEWAIKVGHSNGVMSSFNRIGYEVTANSYAVNQFLLRDEWGSKALVSTDAWAKDYVPVNRMALSGGDQLDGSAKGYAKNKLDYGTWDATNNTVLVKSDETATENTMSDPSLYFGIRSKCQRALYNRANSIAVKNGAVTGKKFTVIVEKGVNNAVKITNDDCNFTLTDDAVATLKNNGLALQNGLITGTPTAEGIITIPASYSLDGWVSSTANIEIDVRSAIHVNDVAMKTGENATTEKANSNFTMKVDIPALSYFTEVGRNLIVNYYQAADGTWYNRNEDKTAADIITTDAETAVAKKEYTYHIDNLPEGVTSKVVTKTVMGKANRTSYEVPDYVEISGNLTAGEYTFDVDLEYYQTMYMMGWLFTAYSNKNASHYTGTVTFNVQ